MSHVVWVLGRTGRSSNADLKRAKPWIICVMRREKGIIKRPRQNSNANGSANVATVGAAETAPPQILPHGFVVFEYAAVDDELVVVFDYELVLAVTVTVLVLVVHCTMACQSGPDG